MANTTFNCDVVQGYTGAPQHGTVGFLTALSLVGTALAADQDVRNPAEPSDVIGVVAVLSQVSWNGNAQDPITVQGHVSQANAHALHLTGTEGTVAVRFAFTVYAFDHTTQTIYPAFASAGEPLHGALAVHNASPLLRVDTTPAGYPPSPHTFAMNLSVVPTSPGQRLTVGYSAANHVDQTWGSTG